MNGIHEYPYFMGFLANNGSQEHRIINIFEKLQLVKI